MNTCDHYNYVTIKEYVKNLKKHVRKHVLAILATYMETSLVLHMSNKDDFKDFEAMTKNRLFTQ